MIDTADTTSDRQQRSIIRDLEVAEREISRHSNSIHGAVVAQTGRWKAVKRELMVDYDRVSNIPAKPNQSACPVCGSFGGSHAQ